MGNYSVKLGSLGPLTRLLYMTRWFLFFHRCVVCHIFKHTADCMSCTVAVFDQSHVAQAYSHYILDLGSL